MAETEPADAHENLADDEPDKDDQDAGDKAGDERTDKPLTARSGDANVDAA